MVGPIAVPLSMIHFSNQLLGSLFGPSGGGRLLDRKDLATIRVWGPRVLELQKGATARFWRDQAFGILFAAGVSAAGYFLLEWSLGTLFVFWFFDLLAVWLGDVLKARSVPRQLELELADAERCFEITQLVQTLRRSRTRPGARPPRVAPDRLKPKFSALAMLSTPAYVIVFFAISAGIAASLDHVSINWWTAGFIACAFFLHLSVAVRDLRHARDKETPQPRLLALSYLPAALFLTAITVFMWALSLALLLENIVRWDLSDHVAGGFIGVYAATAAGTFYLLRRASKRQLNDLRYYLSRSEAWQNSELELMRRS